MQDARHTAYMFQQHSCETVGAWARELQHFRFCRAYGGHANDGDSFKCSVRFQNEAELLDICSRLFIRLVALPLGTPRPVANQAYSWAEFQKFRHPIDAFPHYEQPGHTTVLGVRCFVWIGRDRMDFQLFGASGDNYAVTDADFQNAKRLDGEFEALRLVFLDPPVAGPLCVCPDYWPEFFSDRIV